jgi:O-antigen ligase
MYAVLGILFLLEEFRLKTLSGKWVFPMIGFLAALLILLTARLPLLAGVLLTGIWIMRYYVKKRSARWTIIVSAVIVLGAIIALNSSRWNEFISLRRSGLNDVKENSLLVRLGIYQCSLGLLNQYYLTGVGPDHLQLELDRCYYRFPADVYSRQHFNTHNQYLDYWLSYGIIGLLILCTVFFIPLFIARKQDLIYMLFLLLLLICFLGENILSRQAGIVFYAFFNAMLLTQMTTKRLFDKGQKILQ